MRESTTLDVRAKSLLYTARREIFQKINCKKPPQRVAFIFGADDGNLNPQVAPISSDFGQSSLRNLSSSSSAPLWKMRGSIPLTVLKIKATQKGVRRESEPTGCANIIRFWAIIFAQPFVIFLRSASEDEGFDSSGGGPKQKRRLLGAFFIWSR